MVPTADLISLQFLEDFQESYLEALASIGAPSHWKEGETLFHARSPAQQLYLLKSGSVLLYFPDGRALAVRDPGQALGWSSLVNPFRHTATGLCLTDVDLYQFPREELYRLLQMDADFGQALMRKIVVTMHQRRPYHRGARPAERERR